MNDYDTFLLDAMSTSPQVGAQDRERQYDQLREQLVARLHQSLIGKTSVEIVAEQDALEAAIKRTEMTIRSQAVDLFLPPLPELNITHEAGNDNGCLKSIAADEESLERTQQPEIEWSAERTSQITLTRSIRPTLLGIIRKQLVGMVYIMAGAGLIFAILAIASITRR